MKDYIVLFFTIFALSWASEPKFIEVSSPNTNIPDVQKAQDSYLGISHAQTEQNLRNFRKAIARNLAAENSQGNLHSGNSTVEIEARQRLIGLLVNNKGYDCTNAPLYLATVQSDTANLNFLIKKLDGYLPQISDSFKILKRICDVDENQLNGDPQKNQDGQGANNSNKLTIASLIAEINNAKPSRSNQVEKAIFDKIQAVMESMSKFDSLENCMTSYKIMNDLVDFITSLKAEIKQDLLEEFLPERTQELQDYIKTCKDEAPVTQAGIFTKVYMGTGHEFENGQNIERKESYEIIFEEAFHQLPEVAITLRGFELDYRESGIKLVLGEVTHSGFTFTVYAPPKARLYRFSMGWLATISEKSKIQVYRYSFDAQKDANFAKISQGEGERGMTFPIKFNSTYNNPGVISTLSGFRFSSDKNIRLRTDAIDIKPNGANIKIVTWADTLLLATDLNVIVFERTETQNFGEIRTDVNGPLARNEGERIEIEYVKNVPTTTLVTWPTITLIDFLYGDDYIVNLDTVAENDAIKVTIKTWSDSKLYHLTSDILYTPCKPKKLATQTGVFNRTYSSNHTFMDNPDEDRIDTALITFPVEFEEVPSVAVALRGFDGEIDGAGIFVKAENITTESFTLIIIAPLGSKVSLATVSWLATISNTSRIFTSTIELDTTDEDFAALSKGYISRTADYIVDHPVPLRNPAAYVAISGFKFNSHSDFNLELASGNLTAKNFKLSLKAWDNASISKATITVIHYDQAATQDQVEFTSANHGSDINRAALPKADPSDTPSLVGITLFAAIKSIEYQGKSTTPEKKLQDVILADSLFTLQIPYWASAFNFEVKYGVLYTQQDKPSQD